MANENFDIFAIIPKAAEMMRASWNSLTPEQKAQSLLSRPTRLPDIKVDQPAQPTVEEDSIIKGVYQRGNQRYFPEAQTFPYTKPEDIISELQYERPDLKETPKEPASKDLISTIPSFGINPAAELMDAYDKQTPKGDVPVDNDPTQEFIDVIKKVEGHKEPSFLHKMLGDATSGYKSPEDGKPMIGYGHKLTNKEIALGLTIDGEHYEFKDIYNMSPIQAERLLRQDIRHAEKDAKSWFGKDWNRLSDIEQNAATELVFNMGLGKAKKYSKFKKKILAKDKSWIDEINRTYKTPDGEIKSLTNRTNQLKDYYKKYL